MNDTHLLKFVANGKTTHTSTGIRTFPQQTYGASRQSPDYFQHAHTIITPNTYHYQHQQAPQFEYHSQKKSLKLHPVPSLEIQYSPATLAQTNLYKYHLKKGRLTEFIDKNGWMNTVYVMNGNERSNDSRKVNNKDRTLRLSKLKEKSQYQNSITPKLAINQIKYKTLQEIMSYKIRIRARRLKQAENKLSQTQRVISQKKQRSLEKQVVSDRMASTTSHWYRGRSFGKKRQFSLTRHKGFNRFKKEMENEQQFSNH